MKKHWFVMVICVTLILQNAWGQQVMDLQDCIDAALQNNINIRQRNWQSVGAEIDLRQSRLAQLPNLNGFVSHGINQGRNIDPFTNIYVNQDIKFANFGLTSSLLLFNGLNQYHTIRGNALALEAAELEVQQEKDNIRLSVVLQYLQVLNGTDQIRIMNNQILTTESQLSRLEKMDRDGAISPVDVSDIQGQLASERLNKLEAENARQNAVIALFQLMGIAYDSSIEFDQNSFPGLPVPSIETAEQLLTLSIEQLALIQAAGKRSASASAGIKATKGLLYPSLSLNAGIFSNYSSAARRDIFLGDQTLASTDFVVFNGEQLPVFKTFPSFNSENIRYWDQFKNNYSTTVSLQLQIPLFNGWRTRRQIEMAALQSQQALWLEENTKIQLQQLIAQAHLNLDTSYKRYELTAIQVAAFEASFKANEIRFNQGVIHSAEYNISKNNLDQARLRQTMALYDWYLRKEILVFYGAGR